MVEGQRVLEPGLQSCDLIHMSNEEQSAYTLKASPHDPHLCIHNLLKQTKTLDSNQTTGLLAHL